MDLFAGKLQEEEFNYGDRKLIDPKEFADRYEFRPKIVFVHFAVSEYVPAYPITNRLGFFYCEECNNKPKKVFRLNLKSSAEKKLLINRQTKELPIAYSAIYLCRDHFIKRFTAYSKMIEDFDNDNFDKYETLNN